MTSFHFNKIELEYECEPDPQLFDSIPIFEFMLTPASLPKLDQFSEPTFILVPIDQEIESPILDSHILLMRKECEFQFLDLDLKLKLTLEPKVDFSELVLVSEPIILVPKSTIPPSHILLLNQGSDHNDSVMIFQDWSYEGDNL